MASEQLLSIDVLERDLRNAERELAKATSARQQAQEVEAQWTTEVTSLKNLIQVRKQRMAPGASIPIIVPDGYAKANETNLPGSLNGSAGEDINRVDWIDALVAASGSAGMAPPEIQRKAEQEHLTMHPNYPYVVLKKLVAKERVVKRRGRYYAKGS